MTATETRYAVQCRSELDGNTLHGHAAVFNQAAKVPGGYERLAPGAFDEVLDQSDLDVVAAIDHDMSKVLGRTASGTLRLKADDDGLAFEVELPDTSYANDLRALVSRGDVTGASFGFLPADDGTWTRAADGSQMHTINRIKFLRDVGPVTFPAYKGAGVELRSYDFDQPSGRSQVIRARARVHLRKG